MSHCIQSKDIMYNKGVGVNFATRVKLVSDVLV
jgi:hypothetical protein